jgi:predicted MPP superfamily phosphohydrolase
VWFVYLGIGLTLVVIGGLYVRRRFADALTRLGVGIRRVRGIRWLVAWLLFGYPLIMLVAVVVSLASGRATLVRFDGAIATWLLVYPFFLALLVMVQSLPYVVVMDLVHWWLRRRRGAAIAGKVRAIAVVGVIAGFALYTPIRIIAEHGVLRLRHHQLGPATPSTVPFRIAFVADVQHDGFTDELAGRAVGIVNTSAPDLVLSGGDWINTGPDYIAVAAVTAGAMQSRLGHYSVRGDHEHFAYVDRQRSLGEVERALAAQGVAMLSNQVRWFEHHGKRIAVMFLDHNYLRRIDDATVATLISEIAGADYSIAVTHQLDRRVAGLLKDKVDLVLAAHTHGGQINPVLGVVHVSLARLETEHVDGRYQLGTTTIIVTAGVGYSLVPLRYAAPGSIEIIELRL